ncbi:alternate-type signal peptide domain-containing protein [Schumannella soli]|uniref:Alternate-type signal peptide domain-containing protein n=1 Tax=Schumannella soli TaxID=2590779 RepID=A0A506Y4U0_9MICO|nr:alternate-type signal peptide domain-containing protein [Schumannella soli]TPW75459.1 alternate-type signal peptide domain-containing protein [Schumannella soli]
MNKLTKGAIAGAAGIVLLMGGAGSLAYWTGTASLDNAGQTINAGTLTAVKVTSPAATGWQVNGAAIPANYVAVPGDVITYKQDVKITASGSNLKFTLALADSAITASGTQDTTNPNFALKQRLAQTSAFTIGASPKVSLVTGSTNTYKVDSAGDTTISVTATITWPFDGTTSGSTVAADNLAKTGAVSFGSTVVNLQQVQ